MMRESASSRSRRASGKDGYLRECRAGCKPLARGRKKENTPLFDDMVEPVLRLAVLFQALCLVPLLPPDGLAQLFRKALVLSQLVEQRFMEEILDILYVVERSRS